MKMEGFVGEFSQFAPLFRRGETNYNPLIAHVVEGWELRNNPNVFFTTYEEMSKDLRAVASRLIKFLGKGKYPSYKTNQISCNIKKSENPC